MKASFLRTLQQRGFVIIVVMMLMAVATAVALSQFSIVANQAVTSTRGEEQNQARVTAEACLDLLQNYAEGYMGPPPNFAHPDFDALLDRDGILNNGDDFLPSFGTRVLVPRNLTPTTGAVAAGHQWSFLLRGTGSNQAGCLMRIEDNSDDAFALNAVPVGTTSVLEGLSLGRDVPQRDRDRSIYLTAIGVYPVLPGVPAANAYERAHARVTVRRLFATSNPPLTPPAIQACETVTLSSNTDVCGIGGVQADTITVSGASTCGCGAYVGGSAPPTPPSPCTGCDNGRCDTPSTAVGAIPDCTPPADVPDETYYMDNRGFGKPGINNNVIGDPSSCKVYIDKQGRVFMWDMTDDFANEGAPLGPLKAFVGTTIPAAPRHNCKTYDKDPVELPCYWDTTAGDVDGAGPDTVGEHVVCDFTNSDPRKRQTPCWKPIANLGDSSGSSPGAGLNMNSDVTIGTPVELGGTGKFITANWTEFSSNQNDEDLMFLKNKPIPNIRDQTKMLATGDVTTTMCGFKDSCEDCNGTGNDQWWTECSKRSGTAGTQTLTCEDFHSHAHQNNRNVPWPIVFAWDVDPAFEINFEFESTAAKPLNTTILTNGKIAFGNRVSFCCAECDKNGTDCAQGALPANPGLTSTFIAAADCFAGSPQVPKPTIPVTPPPPGAVAFIPSGYGYAFKADGECDIAADSTVIGDVECKAINIPNDPCLVGHVLVTGSSTGVGCMVTGCAPSTNTTDPNVGICLGGDAKVVGDMYAQGSVCAVANTSIEGDIYSFGNVFLASNTKVKGQIFANASITLSSNAVVDYNGVGQIISVGSKGLTTFMETSW